MWRAGIRAALTFAFTVFGRKVIALIGTVLLLFAAAILIDFKLYISAALASILGLTALIVFSVQYRRQILAKRERIRQQAETAQRRAATSEARAERMDKAKTAVVGAVKGVGGSAADMAGIAKTGLAGARGRIQGWRK